MKARFLFISFILLGLCFSADAQKRKSRAKKPAQKKTVAKKPAAPLKRTAAGDTIKGNTIEIMQSYKPEVKKVPKPEMASNLPPVDTTAPSFSYDVPQQTLSYTYSSFPLRPLALGIDSINVPFANYVKLGGGNLSTLFFDAGIGSLKGEDFETNFQLNHISQTGDIKHQKTSLSGFSANGVQHRNGNAWHAAIDVSHNQYYYYGYDHELLSFTDDSIKQTYTGLRFGIDMQNEYEGFMGLDYHPYVNMSLYNDRFDGAENTFAIGLPVSYNLDTSLKLLAGVSGTFTNYKKPFLTQNNNVVQITPAISYQNGSFNLHAGAYPTFGQETYILPDINTRFKVKGTQFTFVAGWQAQLRQNTFEQLSTINPYMNDRYLVKQTKSDEIFGGIQGNIGTHISFTGRASWWNYNNMPLFINDTADAKQFLIVYDKVKAISLQGSVRYQVATAFALGFSAAWYGYTPDKEEHAWHQPGLVLKTDLMVKPTPSLSITGYLSVMDDIYAYQGAGKSKQLSAVMDLGGSAEYIFIPRLSGFIQVSNLLNTKYQRWQGYTTYGMNVYGGIRFKF